jgi:hypothetical protein
VLQINKLQRAKSGSETSFDRVYYNLGIIYVFPLKVPKNSKYILPYMLPKINKSPPEKIGLIFKLTAFLNTLENRLLTLQHSQPLPSIFHFRYPRISVLP